MASPTIVGSSVPSFSIWIFAIFCFIVAGIQLLGFIGVVQVRRSSSPFFRVVLPASLTRLFILSGRDQEKKGLFKVYVSANMAAVFATFSIAAALVLVSGLKRSTAITSCQSVSLFSLLFVPRASSSRLSLDSPDEIADSSSSKQTFYAASTTNSSTSIAPLADSAEKICTIFTIVDVSVMG